MMMMMMCLSSLAQSQICSRNFHYSYHELNDFFRCCPVLKQFSTPDSLNDKVGIININIIKKRIRNHSSIILLSVLVDPKTDS